MSSIRDVTDLAVDLAEIELRSGAAGNPIGSRKGLWVERYLMGQAKPGQTWQWCALFSSWCLLTAAKSLGYPFVLTLPQRKGAKRLGREVIALTLGKWSTTPERGDLAIYHGGNKVAGHWTWRGHVRLVHSVDADGKTYIGIGGNERDQVKRGIHSVADWRLVGYARLG